MALPIKWSPRAASHLGDICDYIAKDSPHYAALFAQRVFAIVTRIPDFPQAGRIVPEYENESLREKIYGNYRIVYRTSNNIIEIVAVCHAAKPLDDLI